jgi:hypothetical protein
MCKFKQGDAMKNIFLTALILSFFTTACMALDAVSITFSGAVDPIVNISASNANTSLVLSSSETAVKIFDYTIDSNGANGFTLLVSSLNGGQLRSAYSASKPATYLAYTIDIIPQLTGGATTLQTLTGLSLATNKTFTYSQDDPTIAKVWDVKITHPAKVLFLGTFSDTITLTLTNI